MPKGGVLFVAGALVLAASSGSAQSGKGIAKPANKHAPGKPHPLPSAKESAPAHHEPEPAASAAAPAMTGRGEAKTTVPKVPAGDAGVTVLEKDGGRQFHFTETDVEGRLKVPQLVYFLRRVRAEFAAGDLGHRSFMRELSATQREPQF